MQIAALTISSMKKEVSRSLTSLRSVSSSSSISDSVEMNIYDNILIEQ
jgi:hypothetical protein